MPALTIVACPKPFVGNVALIQRNAIESWTRLNPRPEIVLVGDEQGIAETCARFDLRQIGDVQRNERGTPLLSDVLGQGQRLAAPDGIVCFINSDIILMDDFQRAVERAASARKRFLMIGQRTDLDVSEPIGFDDPRWQETLRATASSRGRLHGEDGIDYFVFTSGLFDPVPPLLVGRAAVDNWLVFRARRLGYPVIDATVSVTAVHQNHDYSHHPEGRHGVYLGEEAQQNLQIAGGYDHLFWISDSTHRLTPESLSREMRGPRLRQRWDRLPVLVTPGLRPAVLFLRMLWRTAGVILRAVGLRKTRVSCPSSAS